MNNRSYNLNEVLKARKAARQDRQAQDGEVKLDDLSRVKVLSPGRQVFKRFIRNRLAVFGSVTLIVMFLFSFLGPVFYPYDQKQIFYKYEPRNVNYGMVKENTAYIGFDIEDDAPKDSLHSATVERTVNNKMNSIIKNMLADQADVDYITVTIDPNGGDFASGNTAADPIYRYLVTSSNSTLSLPTPKRKNFTFLGWQPSYGVVTTGYSDSQYVDGMIFNFYKDITLTAQWRSNF